MNLPQVIASNPPLVGSVTTREDVTSAEVFEFDEIISCAIPGEVAAAPWSSESTEHIESEPVSAPHPEPQTPSTIADWDPDEVPYRQAVERPSSEFTGERRGEQRVLDFHIESGKSDGGRRLKFKCEGREATHVGADFTTANGNEHDSNREAMSEKQEEQVIASEVKQNEQSSQSCKADPETLERAAYVRHFRTLLELEQQAEAAQVRDRLRKPLSKLEVDGLACGGLWPEPRPFQTLALTRAIGIPFLAEISPGRTVLLTPEASKVWLPDNTNDGADDSGDSSWTTVFAEVIALGPDEILVSCNAKSPWGPLRLDLGPNLVAHRRFIDALVAIARDEGRGYRDNGPPAMGLFAYSSALARAFFGTSPAEHQKYASLLWEEAQKVHIEVPRPKWVSYPSGMYRAAGERLRASLTTGARSLNTSQELAVMRVATQRHQLTLIQGPPGTGKTATAIEIVRALLREERGPILVTAFTNRGLDNLAEGLYACGVNVLRIGTCSASLPFSLEGHLRAYDFKKDERTSRQMQDVLGGAHVVCATCVGAGMSILTTTDFPFVVIDEAAQCIEPATLVPLVKGCVQAVLLGDHRQLPATVISREAEKRGLGRSLFERLAGTGNHSHMLTVQYRMHPAICCFPSWRFYDGRLKTGIQPENRLPVKNPWGFGNLVFIHVEATELRCGASSASTWNRAEAVCVGWLVDGLLGRSKSTSQNDAQDGAESDSPESSALKPDDIGVITPYLAQIAAIRKALQNHCPAKVKNKNVPPTGVRVCSVDGFQGSERDAIILSLVRANPRGEIGFVQDARRLNVSITRARRLLVVVGNFTTLAFHEVWREFLGFSAEPKCYEWLPKKNGLGEPSEKVQALLQQLSAEMAKREIRTPELELSPGTDPARLLIESLPEEAPLPVEPNVWEGKRAESSTWEDKRGTRKGWMAKNSKEKPPRSCTYRLEAKSSREYRDAKGRSYRVSDRTKDQPQHSHWNWRQRQQDQWGDAQKEEWEDVQKEQWEDVKQEQQEPQLQHEEPLQEQPQEKPQEEQQPPQQWHQQQHHQQQLQQQQPQQQQQQPQQQEQQQQQQQKQHQHHVQHQQQHQQKEQQQQQYEHQEKRTNSWPRPQPSSRETRRLSSRSEQSGESRFGAAAATAAAAVTPLLVTAAVAESAAATPKQSEQYVQQKQRQQLVQQPEQHEKQRREAQQQQQQQQQPELQQQADPKADVAIALPGQQQNITTHIAPAGDPELVQAWAECMLDAARLTARKARAIAEEDYDLAHTLKLSEPDIVAALARAKKRAVGAAFAADAWREAGERKRRAVLAEEYEVAAELKRCQEKMEAEYEVQLASVQLQKRRCIEVEDYDGAAKLKAEERRLHALQVTLEKDAASAALAKAEAGASSLPSSSRLADGAALMVAVAAELRREVEQKK